MSDLNRRQFVKLSGAGAGLAFGAGAGSARPRGTSGPGTMSDFPVGFTATANNGYIVVDGDDPSDSSATINIGLGQLDGDITIEGEIYEDKTWQSSNVTFPEIDPAELIDADEIDIVKSIEFDQSQTNIEIVVDTIEGTYDPEQDLVIGNIDMLIDVEVYGTAVIDAPGDPSVDFSFIFYIDVNDGQDIQLTTEQSGTLEGGASGLDSENPAAVVVNNDYIVPEAEGEKVEHCEFGICINVNEELNLPSNNPLRNFMQLGLSIDWDNEPPQFGLPPIPGGEGPPQDLDGDGLHEDITGSGEVSVFDTQALFDNLDSSAVQDNAGAFNFNDYSPDDKVTIFDVASHWKQNVYE